MGHFTNNPVRVDFLAHITGKRQFQLIKPVTYTTDSGLQITVRMGFITDFASIPRWYRWRFDPCGKHGRAAIIHDWLYASEKLPRDQADRIFLEAMAADNVNSWNRKVMYRAVRLGGGATWADHTDESVEAARQVGMIRQLSQPTEN